MKILFVEDFEAMSHLGVDHLATALSQTKQPIVNLNTGGTMREFYAELVKRANNQTIDLTETTLTVLDEYIGPKEAPYTVYRYMHEEFLDLLDDSLKEVYFIQGDTDNPTEEINRYRQILANHPRDFQLLGLGTNGHIGANEPGTSFDATMFLADHDQSTIESTIKEYDLDPQEAPDQMLTLGFAEILAAKEILLLISGKHKAQATKDFLEGDITVDVPVTALRNHPNVTVIIDEDAASLLSEETRKNH